MVPQLACQTARLGADEIASLGKHTTYELWGYFAGEKHDDFFQLLWQLFNATHLRESPPRAT